MSYKAKVCKIKGIKEHPNADRINLAVCFNNQVVIGKDVEEGTLGVYFPSDGQLTSIFLSENNLYRDKTLNKDKEKSGFFELNGRVRVQKFRGEESDGIWLPIECLDFVNGHDLQEYDEFDTVSGIKICQKYISPSTKRTTGSSKGKQKRKPKDFTYPLFTEHVDTDQLKYNLYKLEEGELVVITEKLHGTSGRTGNLIKKKNTGIFKNIINKYLPKTWATITGTRRVILDDFNDPKKQGYYGTNEFRKVYHDYFKDRLKKGETIYYEIVGWVDENKSIMGIGKNKKLKDKEFIKRYGDTTIFSYGCKQGQSDIYVYRITITNEDGDIVEYSWPAIKERCEELGVKHVPELDRFFFDGDHDSLMAYIKELYDNCSTIDSSHLMEGIVLRVEDNLKFKAYKDKSFNFKVLEGHIKEENILDMEEAESVEEDE